MFSILADRDRRLDDQAASLRRDRMRLQRTLFATLIGVMMACGDGGPAVERPSVESGSGDALMVYTVNYPLAYFAERIGNDLVEVEFPVPAHEDPAFWKPAAETIAAYQRADLILLNGAGYAKWTELAALPSSRVVDTSEGVGDRLLQFQGAVTHSHGPEGEHEHVGYAFTTWLDPEIAIQQAQVIAAAIALERPEQEADIQRRMEVLKDHLVDLDSRLQVAAEAIGDAPLLFSHPVYQYLINRYQLNGVEVHWEPDEAPDEQTWEHLKKTLENHPAKWMVWESEPQAKTVAELEARGIASVVFDPCGNRPEAGDYLSVMAANAAALESVAR
jgi:zinc transport system substrate-binding protein